MSERYANKRVLHRGAGGKFRKATAQDMGIGGVCKVCRHLLISVYEGDMSNIDPRGFRYRCFTCEPLTDAEKAEAAEREEKTRANFTKFFTDIAEKR